MHTCNIFPSLGTEVCWTVWAFQEWNEESKNMVRCRYYYNVNKSLWTENFMLSIYSWAFMTIHRILCKPRQVLDVFNLCPFSILSVAHIPVISLWITANLFNRQELHLKSWKTMIFLILDAPSQNPLQYRVRGDEKLRRVWWQDPLYLLSPRLFLDYLRGRSTILPFHLRYLAPRDLLSGNGL